MREKTAIVHKANLNFVRARKYLALLSEEGLIDISKGLAINYRTTKKGMDFLRAYRENRDL